METISRLMVELVKTIEDRKPLSAVKGIAWKGGINERRPPPDVNKLRPPGWHRFNIDVYRLMNLPTSKPDGFCFPVLSGRGCPYRCGFCYRADYASDASCPSAQNLSHIVDKHNSYSPPQNKGNTAKCICQVASFDHFATFPPKLIEPCISAGTSEKGCCAACGAPWERVVDKETVWRNRPNKYCSYREINGQPDQTKAGISTKTIGWQPTCKCNTPLVRDYLTAQKGPPCTVLDPFAGAGTTLLVSEKYSRKWIGIELSQDYCSMIIDRLKPEIQQRKLF